MFFTATTTDTAIEIPYDILTFVRLRTQKNRNSLGNNTLHESYRNRRHGTTTNAVYGGLSVFLLSQHAILERYFASACGLRKPRTPKDSKGSKGPLTPPHTPTGPRNPPGGSGRGHDVGKCLLLNDRRHTCIQSVNATFLHPNIVCVAAFFTHGFPRPTMNVKYNTRHSEQSCSQILLCLTSGRSI